ncbi:MAG TPA: carboxylesterase family protein [Actinophytocola sp.]|uniref:carboxylesterase/lipase family protein n=1 Tax=Actinophytocola sp. TaxID=1872138 RepID=UPI002DB6BD01|nr:carboxylesterase family protein [Actinophytocola sp.]HEU5472660.1 carboxylesterase family protein [Actinophytocola sp.]
MSPATTLRTRLGVPAIALAAVLTGAGPAGAAPDHDRAPVVATTGGLVRGVATATTDTFLGLPYAAPPVRWQPPQPAARWSGIRDAAEFAPHCAQPAGPFGAASTSEDCLYLNVFTPSGESNARHRNPVLVWIHGGALVTGMSDTYDPTRLVAGDDVVVVTINYRLGALGFLAHPALAAATGGPTGNYGLMDQQAALRWVQRNIARFGGNPHDVTIFGESAGGLSVLSQLVSPGARGTFDRAVVQSGAYALDLADQARAEVAGRTYAAAVGCPDQSAACLRALPVPALLAGQSRGYEPNVDGRVLPGSIGTALAAGDFARVPVINGSTGDEWRLFVGLNELAGQPVTAANYQAQISATLGVPAPVAAVIAARYPLSAYPSPAEALGAVGTDAIFACPGLTVSRSVSRFVPTYQYEFNDRDAPPLLPPVSFPYGAFHAAEIAYLFPPETVPFTPAQHRLSEAMRGYWAGFARLGTPNTHRTPFWPRFTASGERVQSLVPPHPRTATGFATAHKCAFWAAATQ